MRRTDRKKAIHYTTQDTLIIDSKDFAVSSDAKMTELRIKFE